MKRYYILLAIIVLLISNMGYVNGTTLESDNEIDRTLGYINSIRNRVGVNELVISDELKEASKVHTKYMYYNDSFSSVEESSKLYYRGKYPSNRASYYLYEKPYVYELINNLSETYKAAIKDYINNPYSRTVLFDPVYDDIGMGNFEGLYTFTFGGESRDTDTEVVYPYNNQLNIQTAWNNTYEINPYQQMGIEDGDYGVPITYTYYSDKLKVDYFEVNSIDLINTTTGDSIPYKIITPDIDKYLKNTLVVLPLEAYSSETKYEVKLDLKVYFTNYKTQDVLYNGHFVTGVSVSENDENEKLLTREICTEAIIRTFDFPLLEPFFITFHDVDIKSTSSKYIHTAYVLGIVLGYDEYNTIFAPEHNINKEQVYTMIIRAYEKDIHEITHYEDTVDLDDYDEISDWAIEENIIQKANSLGILIKDDNNEINPKSYITENEFEDIIEKLEDIINAG